MNTTKRTTDNYNKLEHLKLIEAIIARLAGNAHNIKVLTITLSVAIFTFAPHLTYLNGRISSILISLLVGTFFILGNCYSSLEHAYVMLYNEVSKQTSTNKEYNLKINQFKTMKNWLRPYFSIINSVFYLGVLSIGELSTFLISHYSNGLKLSILFIGIYVPLVLLTRLCSDFFK